MLKLTFLLAGLTLISACATIEGAGQDLQSAGSAVSREARQAESDL